MTNMQHYMEDIHDLLDGLDDEMSRRLEKLAKWDCQMAKYTEEILILEDSVFGMSNSSEVRTDKLARLADLRGRLRDLAERKVELADRNHTSVQAVYSKISELAYHCKCEIEIDNPGCAEQREKQFYRSLEEAQNESVSQVRMCSLLTPSQKATRELSILTDDDRNSTRSVTPFGKELSKKKVGRPRSSTAKGKMNSSAYSSTRSSVEHDTARFKKNVSKYMRKKHEKLRLEENERTNVTLDIKKELREDFEGFEIDQWSEIGEKPDTAADDDERDLLECLLPGFELGGIPSPPKGMMEALDVTESDLRGMEMYPDGHKQLDKHDFTSSIYSTTIFQSSENPGACSTRTRININAATSSNSGELAERRKRNMLFGSIADTSFSGRPRKLTDRVAEMIQSNREKEIRQKMKRESEEWCFCGGANVNSEMMVECDYKNCRTGWFHFDCVGLVECPKAEWYCPECQRSVIDEGNLLGQFDVEL